MARKNNTDRNGAAFSEETKRIVWNKATPIVGYDPRAVRRDSCHATISWSEYGNTDSKRGWEIDHIRPVSRGGGDDLMNLQPLQWQNNRKKGDDFPAFGYCLVRD